MFKLQLWIIKSASGQALHNLNVLINVVSALRVKGNISVMVSVIKTKVGFSSLLDLLSFSHNDVAHQCLSIPSLLYRRICFVFSNGI